jgi:hypothetical protein
MFDPPPVIQKKMSAEDYVHEVLNGENQLYISAQLELKVFYEMYYKSRLSCPVRLTIPTKQELVWAMREAHPECPTTFL